MSKQKNSYLIYAVIESNKKFQRNGGVEYFQVGIGRRSTAACKPNRNQQNQPFTISKISWKSKPDPNIAIPVYKKKI